MLNSLRIENFKAWRDTGRLRFAPLTVLFGSNSAGKTSLTQFLLMLKQTMESPDRKRVLHPGDRTTPVDLGTSRDLVFNHDLDLPLTFQVSFSLPSRLKVTDPKGTQSASADTVGFGATIRHHGDRQDRLQVESMSYQLFDKGNQELAAKMELHQATKSARGRPRYRLQADNYDLVWNLGRKWPLPPPIRFYGFPDEAIAYYQNTGFLADLTLALELQFRRLLYLGPLRGYPERSYVWSGETTEHVGHRGERAIEALLAARDRKISRGYRKRREPFQTVVARWLKCLGLIESFRVHPIGEGRKEHEVLIRVRDGSSEVNLMDVGFGLSQLLPVIVECFCVPADSTVIFEQPEIHLHPAVQAGLADLFVETIHAREHGRDRSVQVVVESHSEHFLRRLQRRIAEERVSPKEVALYFCEPGPSGASIRELEVDLYGNISNWPTGFFGDEMADLTAMTDAAMRRVTGAGA